MNIALKSLILSSLLLLSGCGSSDKWVVKYSEPLLINEGLALNSIGYYGDNVLFADMPIKGAKHFYKFDEEGLEPFAYTLRFNDDVEHLTAYQGTVIVAYYGAYGVNGEGSILTIDKGSEVDIYTVIEYATNAGCAIVLNESEYLKMCPAER